MTCGNEVNVMKFSLSGKTKSSPISKRLMTWTTVCAAFVFVIVAYSETAHAGLFSYIGNILGSEQASAKVTQNKIPFNSQKIALLQAASNIDPNPEKISGTSPVVGNALVADMTLSEAAVGLDDVSTQISTYIVREGDTLTGIAKMFKVSPNTIVWANDLDRSKVLQPGKQIVILPVTGLKIVVKSGDTIRGIVQKYKADLDEVLQYNDITLTSTLVIGQTIIIPDVELSTPTPAPTKAQVKGYVKNNAAHDTNGPDLGSYFMRPCEIGSCVKTQGLHGYNGVDLAGPTGTPLYASAAGTVIVSKTSGWNGGYGIHIVISHPNGTQTVYGHLSKNLVTVGQHVDKGQHIGNIGSTGNSTGPHVHFEIRGAKNPF